MAGHTALTKLCDFLNMPPPMTKNAYNDLSYSINFASKQIAGKSMSDAATRLCGTKKAADVRVSVDVTWQRKVFTSTLRVVTAISFDSGKILDVTNVSKS